MPFNSSGHIHEGEGEGSILDGSGHPLKRDAGPVQAAIASRDRGAYHLSFQQESRVGGTENPPYRDWLISDGRYLQATLGGITGPTTASQAGGVARARSGDVFSIYLASPRPGL